MCINFKIAILLCLVVEFINSAKILIFDPVLSGSQIVFYYRVADLLAENGHDVTLLNIQFDPDAKKGKLKSNAKEIHYKPLKNESLYRELNKLMADTIYGTSGMSFDLAIKLRNSLLSGCETLMSDKSLIKKLKNAKYDLAFTHIYDLCTIGMVKVLEIPTHIWMSSGPFIDWMAFVIGSPVPSSYVPNVMASFSDRMTFKERMQNFLTHVLFMPMVKMLSANPETKLFRKYHGEKFPDLIQLASKSPLVFINSEELLDFPRPILHKVIYMGGIGMSTPNPLKPDWQKIMDDSQDGVILFSFGSFANPRNMPDSWKEAFITAFSKFSTYTFVWKYDGELPAAAKVPNIMLSNWVPQNDMFGHPKMKAFITHAGLNSLLEAGINGIPLIVIPLFGDQPGNRRKAERQGIAIGIDKEDVNAKKVTGALEKVLKDPTYKTNAETLSRMIRNKPFKAEDVVIRWVNFLAEFKQLPNLEPVAIELSLIEYFLIDVMVSILLGFILFCYIVFRVMSYLCSKKSTQEENGFKKRKAE